MGFSRVFVAVTMVTFVLVPLVVVQAAEGNQDLSQKLNCDLDVSASARYIVDNVRGCILSGRLVP